MDDDGLRRVLEAVRAASSPAVWSRGVELNRAGAATGERADDDEVVFRVAERGGMISRLVTLFPEDGEWDCECGAREGACEHAAASVIAWQRSAERGGSAVDAGPARGRVGYRFERADGGLALRRVIVGPDGEEPLEVTLAALADRRVDGPRFVAAQADLAAELALERHRSGPLPRRLADRVLRALAACDDVALDGRPVRTSDDPLLPRVRVRDAGEGFRVTLEPAGDADESFANGIVLCAGTLRPVGEPAVTARERQDLERGAVYGPDSVAELVTEVLPSLRRRVPVDVTTERLPETVRERPRVSFETRADGRRLEVLATLVYGDPPRARVDGGRLVPLSGTVPLRDPDAERRLVARLSRELGLTPGVRAALEGADAVELAGRLERFGGIPAGGWERFRLAPPLVPRIEAGGATLEVEFASLAGGRGADRAGTADPAEVLRAWRAGQQLVPLLEGGWAPLPADWLERFGHRLSDLLAARDAAGRLPPVCLPDLAALCDELEQPPPPGFQRLRRLLEGVERIPVADLPDDLTATLRDYQRRGVDWLSFLRDAGLGALLADDMGLGKTLQALCALRGRTLVVAPTSVLSNWAAEAARFRPGLRVSVYHGPERRFDDDADLTLTTYAILRLDATPLAARRWDTVVLDEAQAIKNPDSQVARAAFDLDAAFRVAMTGTPVENRLEELWSQLHFANRGLLGGRRDFRERYADPIAAGDADAAARLRERIAPFVLRRLKSAVAPELPPRTEMVLRCELDPDERRVYDAVRAATREDVVARLRAGGGVIAALEALLRLRQAACHPALVPGQEAGGSSKVGLLLEALDNVVAEGRKALVFSQWTSLLDLAEPHLRGARVPFLRLDGSTRDRGGVVASFQDEAGPPVLLVSLRAGGSGLNLTAADHVFLLDPWWNPAVEDQAADRAHRIGQDRPVMVYRLVATDTVEERILALQESKRELAEAALGEAGRAAAISREELLGLLA